MWELDHKESWSLKNWWIRTVVLEKTLESPLDCKEIKPVNPEENQSWIFIGRTDAEVEAPILWPPDANNWLLGKDPDAGKDWRWEEKGTTEDEMVKWHHWLGGHEFEQAPGVGDGQGGLACCSPWGRKESDMTKWLNWTDFLNNFLNFFFFFFDSAGSSWLPGLFSCGKRGLLSSCSVQASHCCGFSCCSAQVLGMQASVVVAPRLQSTGSIIAVHLLRCSAACGIFLDQGSNLWLLYIGRQILYHSLIAQLVKNPPAMKDTPVWFLGQEDPLKKA